MTKSTEDIIQFKLTNGDEIICEIISWDAETGNISVNNALCMIQYKSESTPEDVVYMFKPWMTLQKEVGNIITINSYSIICSYEPTSSVKVKYLEVLLEVQTMLMSDLSEEGFDNMLDSDSSEPPSKVINLFSSKTKH